MPDPLQALGAALEALLEAMAPKPQGEKDAATGSSSDASSAAACGHVPAGSDGSDYAASTANATDDVNAHRSAGALSIANGGARTTNGAQSSQPVLATTGVHHESHHAAIQEGQASSQAGASGTDQEADQSGQTARSIRQKDASEGDEEEVMSAGFCGVTPRNTWWSSEEEWRQRSRSSGDNEEEGEAACKVNSSVSRPVTYYTSNYYREPKELSSVYGSASASGGPSKQKKSAHFDDAHLETEPKVRRWQTDSLPSARESVARNKRRLTAPPKTVPRAYSGSEDDLFVTSA